LQIGLAGQQLLALIVADFLDYFLTAADTSGEEAFIIVAAVARG
jgi:hypothetical protein